MLALIRCALCAVAIAASGTSEADPDKHRVSVQLGFGHWFGQTFGNPIGYTTPMVAVGVRPQLRWLELRLRYTFAADPQPVPGGGKSIVGFASVGARVGKALRSARHEIDVFFGPELMLTHTDARSVGWGFGIEAGSQYLIHTGLRLDNAFGIVVAAHEVFYTLPRESSDIVNHGRRDAQIDIGVVATIF